MKGRYEDENLKWIPVLIIAIYLFPFLLKNTTFSYKYYLYILNMAGIYIILTAGLDLLSGFTGLMSLGHAAFLAIGAYASAILVDQVGLPFELSLIPIAETIAPTPKIGPRSIKKVLTFRAVKPAAATLMRSDMRLIAFPLRDLLLFLRLSSKLDGQ